MASKASKSNPATAGALGVSKRITWAGVATIYGKSKDALSEFAVALYYASSNAGTDGAQLSNAEIVKMLESREITDFSKTKVQYSVNGGEIMDRIGKPSYADAKVILYVCAYMNKEDRTARKLHGPEALSGKALLDAVKEAYPVAQATAKARATRTPTVDGGDTTPEAGTSAAATVAPIVEPVPLTLTERLDAIAGPFGAIVTLATEQGSVTGAESAKLQAMLDALMTLSESVKVVDVKAANGTGKDSGSTVAPVVTLTVPAAPPSPSSVVEAVKAYAVEHYTDGGWDVIVETMSDEDIAREIGGARTLNGAVKKLRPLVSLHADRQADARNSA